MCGANFLMQKQRGKSIVSAIWELGGVISRLLSVGGGVDWVHDVKPGGGSTDPEVPPAVAAAEGGEDLQGLRVVGHDYHLVQRPGPGLAPLHRLGTKERRRSGHKAKREKGEGRWGGGKRYHPPRGSGWLGRG